MPTFLVRTLDEKTGRQSDWQEVQAATAQAAVQKVCKFPVAEAVRRLNVCAEARAGSKAAIGRFYRRT